MHRDLFDFAQPLKILQRELDWPLDESAYFETEILETTRCEVLPVVADGHFPIGPKIR